MRRVVGGESGSDGCTASTSPIAAERRAGRWAEGGAGGRTLGGDRPPLSFLLLIVAGLFSCWTFVSELLIN